MLEAKAIVDNLNIVYLLELILHLVNSNEAIQLMLQY